MNKKLWLIIAAGLITVLAVLILSQGNQKTATVGVCYREDADPTSTAYRTALEQALSHQGYQVITTDADRDQSRQLQQLRELAGRPCDALIVEPVMLSAAEELLQVLDEAAIPTVVITNLAEQFSIDERSFITCIDACTGLAGSALASHLLKLPQQGDINGDGTVSYALLQGPEDHPDSTLVSQSFEAALTEQQLAVHCLSVGYTDWSAQNAQDICAQLLSAYGKDIEVILCYNDNTALGAVQAIADAGRAVGQDLYVYALDAQKQVRQLLKDGQLTGAVETDVKGRVQAVVDAVTGHLNGQPVTAAYQPTDTVISAENNS